MKIVVDLDGKLVLKEAGDVRRLKLVVAPGEMAREWLAHALRGLGRLDDNEDAAWIDPDSLRGLAERRNDHSWLAEFDAMLSVARKHGWIDETTGAVRVHIERLAH